MNAAPRASAQPERDLQVASTCEGVGAPETSTFVARRVEAAQSDAQFPFGLRDLRSQNSGDKPRREALFFLVGSSLVLSRKIPRAAWITDS
jgi:hypothetical protein